MYTPPPRRKLTKAERQQVYDICHGHCAYCGTEITPKQMQVDHVIPMEFYEVYKAIGFDVDSMDNYLPACRSCNNYKHTLSIARFRQAAERWPEILQRDSVTYRNAVRFGLVKPEPRPVRFYFEQTETDVPSLRWEV